MYGVLESIEIWLETRMDIRLCIYQAVSFTHFGFAIQKNLTSERNCLSVKSTSQ